MRKPAYADLADFDEDHRIEMIGQAVMSQRGTVAFITDADPGKADRYIEKLKKRFPGIVIISRNAGPTKNTVTVKVGPPAHGAS